MFALVDLLIEDVELCGKKRRGLDKRTYDVGCSDFHCSPESSFVQNIGNQGNFGSERVYFSFLEARINRGCKLFCSSTSATLSKDSKLE